MGGGQMAFRVIKEWDNKTFNKQQTKETKMEANKKPVSTLILRLNDKASGMLKSLVEKEGGTTKSGLVRSLIAREYYKYYPRQK